MWFARGYFEEQASRMFARAAFWAIVSLQGLIAISGIGQTILYFQRLELDQSLSDTRLSERNSSVQVLHWSQQYRAPRPDPASKTFLSKFLDPLQLLSLCEIRPLNCFRCGCFGQNGSYLARTSSTWHEVNPLQNKSPWRDFLPLTFFFTDCVAPELLGSGETDLPIVAKCFSCPKERCQSDEPYQITPHSRMFTHYCTHYKKRFKLAWNRTTIFGTQNWRPQRQSPSPDEMSKATRCGNCSPSPILRHLKIIASAREH